MNGFFYYLHNISAICFKRDFKGWGRKRTGRFALWCHNRFGGTLSLLEDGFIRSVGLGVEGSPSFAQVDDDKGIYYDATVPSRLENLLNTYDFNGDTALMKTADEAMALIQKYRISKYNHAPEVPEGFFDNGTKRRVLVIAQTMGDASLHYGMAEHFTTDEMIDAAFRENPDAEIWIKLHPDVLNGKKSSDIDTAELHQKCRILAKDFNPISLLVYFDTVYTKTSQMGFEAVMLGKKCVCFGLPFYAGWGITDDRLECSRRNRMLSVRDVFAAAYILYTRYFNPYQNRSSDILDTIHEIVRLKQ